MQTEELQVCGFHQVSPYMPHAGCTCSTNKPQTPKIKKTGKIAEEDLVELREAVKAYVEFYQKPSATEDQQSKYEHPIFEKAVELFCGEEFWEEYQNKFFV